MAKPTTTQAAIKQLLDNGSGVKDIAHRLGISESSVNSHMSRMRKAGILPKAKRGRRTTAVTAEPKTAPAQTETAIRVTPSVEEHTKQELDRVKGRREQVLEDIDTLNEERDGLYLRERRLDRALAALTSKLPDEEAGGVKANGTEPEREFAGVAG